MPKADEQPKEEVKEIETDIERVHEKAMHDIELEDNGGGDEAEEELEKDEAEAEPEEEPAEEAPEEVKPEPKEPEPSEEPEPEEVVPPVRVQDSEGEWHEFDTIDDVPDDFEPSTYKAWAKATQEFAKNGLKREEAEQKAMEKKLDAEQAQRIKEINAAWDKEVDTLVEGGLIDAKERKDKTEAVFSLMKEEMEKGYRIDSFTQAFEIYNYRESLKGNDEAKKQEAKAKKERGARVLATGAPSPAKPSRGNVIEAPPTGTTLDQVHEHILGSL